jgi:hypothetical protein
VKWWHFGATIFISADLHMRPDFVNFRRVIRCYIDSGAQQVIPLKQLLRAIVCGLWDEGLTPLDRPRIQISRVSKIQDLMRFNVMKRAG